MNTAIDIALQLSLVEVGNNINVTRLLPFVGGQSMVLVCVSVCVRVSVCEGLLTQFWLA